MPWLQRNLLPLLLRGAHMTILQICVLAVTAILLVGLIIQARQPDAEPAPRVALVYLPHQCQVCFRGYRSAEVLHFHLYGLDGEGQHGCLPQITPLEIDGDACVGTPQAAPVEGD
jgi:hypothetical protein